MTQDLKKTLPILFAGFISFLYLLGVFLRHIRLESFGYDLGIFGQEIYLLSFFKLPFSTVKIPNMVIWGDHWSPSLIFFSPIIWILKRPDMALLISQVIFFFLSQLVIFKIIHEKTKDYFFAFMLLFTYSFFYGISNAIFFDFHPIFIAAMFVPLLYYLFDKNHTLQFFLLTFFLANLQENIALYLVAFGIALLFTSKKKWGIVLIVMYTVWFFLIINMFIPFFSPTHQYLYAQNLDGPLDILLKLFIPFEKIKVFVVSFWNYSLLPLFSPFSVLLSLVNFLENALGEGTLSGRWGFDRHYKVMLGPILALGAVEGYLFFRSKFKKDQFRRVKVAVIINMLLAIILFQYFLHLQLNLLTKKAYWQIDDNKKVVHKLINQLRNTDQSIATQNNIISHLINREKIYLISYQQQGSCIFDPKNSKVILVDLTPNQPAVNFLGCSPKEIKKGLQELIATQKYLISFKKDEIFLLEKTK